jgi:hypothetical protein
MSSHPCRVLQRLGLHQWVSRQRSLTPPMPLAIPCSLCPISTCKQALCQCCCLLSCFQSFCSGSIHHCLLCLDLPQHPLKLQPQRLLTVKECLQHLGGLDGTLHGPHSSPGVSDYVVP